MSAGNENLAHDLLLTVDGVRYAGWTDGSVERGIDKMSGGFRLSLSDPWDGTPPIDEQSRCTLSLGSQVVITGYVDSVEVSEGPTSHTITVSGRDAAGDLIDCSAVHASGEWRGLSLPEIVQQLVTPFGVPVRAEVDAGATFSLFRLEEGETVWRAIERACRYRQVICVSDGRGGLLLTRTGSGRADVELRRGENCMSLQHTRDTSDRFSAYRVKGQRDAADDEDASVAAHGLGEAQDPGVKRYRPKVIVADDQADDVSLADRARWEARVRAGRGQTITATVQGWRQTPGGRLWQPNERARVRWRRIDREMLIVSVRHQLGSGTTTDLTLQPPETFDILPLHEPADGETW